MSVKYVNNKIITENAKNIKDSWFTTFIDVFLFISLNLV